MYEAISLLYNALPGSATRSRHSATRQERLQMTLGCCIVLTHSSEGFDVQKLSEPEKQQQAGLEADAQQAYNQLPEHGATSRAMTLRNVRHQVPVQHQLPGVFEVFEFATGTKTYCSVRHQSIRLLNGLLLRIMLCQTVYEHGFIYATTERNAGPAARGLLGHKFFGALIQPGEAFGRRCCR